ncbi:DUF6634 family protein [Bradyrhizobium sp.]
MPTRESVTAALADRERLIEGWRPGDAELAGAPLLDDWMIERDNGVHNLIGAVTGHPLVNDGWMTTSAVVVMSEEDGWARTVSRWYRLGRRLKLRAPE